MVYISTFYFAAFKMSFVLESYNAVYIPIMCVNKKLTLLKKQYFFIDLLADFKTPDPPV